MLDSLELPAASLASTALSALANLAGTREVEVELPLLQAKATVIPLVGSEELRLHTMRTSGSAFIKSFNKILFEHTTFEGIKFTSITDFEMHLSPPDKKLLVYGLLDATFSELPEKIIKCPSCGTPDTHKPSPSDIFHKDTITKEWEHKESFEDYEIVSEVVPGLTVIYKMPTEIDRLEIISEKENSDLRDNITEHGDILSNIELFSIYIKRMEIKNGEETIVLTDKVKDIIPTVTKMPLELQIKLLEDTSIQEFSEFTPEFYLNIKCSNPACELGEFKWSGIDPEQDFFRKALSIYN